MEPSNVSSDSTAALGRLAVTAEEVEHALGLPPIEVEPVEEVA